jgi:hypothetical protein
LVRKLKGKGKEKTKEKNYSRRKKVLMASFLRRSRMSKKIGISKWHTSSTMLMSLANKGLL